MARVRFIMATIFTDLPIDAEREREITAARADLLRRAEAQGIKPITSPEDLAGNAEIAANFDVDQFLRQVREDRNRS